MINPECKPGHHNDHKARDVHGDHEVGQLPGKHQVHLQTTVHSCIKTMSLPSAIPIRVKLTRRSRNVTIVLTCGPHFKSSRQTDIVSKLKSFLVLPDVDQVIWSPAIWNEYLLDADPRNNQTKPLTAGHIQIAGLLVKREEGEVHGAGNNEGDPDKEMSNSLLRLLFFNHLVHGGGSG